MDLDIEYVRKQFPAFDVPDLINKGFFENAGGSYVPKNVIEKLNNLDQLPNYGFKVSAFPFKIKNGSAGFVRVVAIFE